MQPIRRHRVLAELKQLSALATPIIAAQIATSGMGLVDTLMAGNYNATTLAAVAVGNSIWLPIFLFMRGLMMAIVPSVAHLVGAGKTGLLASTVQQSLWIAVVAGFGALILVRHAEIAFLWLEVTPAVALEASRYLDAFSWSFPAMALYLALSCYCEGRSQTKPGMVFAFAGFLLNIPANYALIYGGWGFPELGAAGCGYATALSAWLMLVCMGLYIALDNGHRSLGILARLSRPQLALIAPLVRLGIPIGISIFVEASIFSVIALLIGRLPTELIAGHQIALNVSAITYMVPLSIGLAMTVRVGQAAGSGDFQQARRAALTGIGLNTLLSSLSAVLLMLFSLQIVSLYSDNSAVLEVAAYLLLFAAAYQLPDALQVAAASSLRGYKDTRVPMLIVLISYWVIALPLGYTLGLTDRITEAMGPAGFWIGLLTGLSTAALLLGWRLQRVFRRYRGHPLRM
ncbi:MATE family efflux transporter [Aestuariirhabdus litorea]|uniref:Multidrug-efflux transporter n=1 Tax=Aestuariirhabdus litorea TaxID=2528527 RepID=A0A3P3VQ64_9GAMM|nr:MATE family efflux transporter [Aestuariirhabdus litorea]RRJ84467.1 MATE family efflux transporter [Aestuariirhabdus litorea]RWW97691.1 MATE family efflux transporter [Endozoicomonadaceae bacterium GTF-13]